MKNRYLLLISCLLICGFASGQNSDTSLITINNYKLFEGTHSWRGDGKFFDMTPWDSQPYKEGHLKQLSGSSWMFRLNYRLLFPTSYDANYEKGYPLLIMFHGAGERGNCWETNCYCEGCDANAAANPNANPRFLNNDHALVHGGQPFLNAVTLAGSKKADDPTLNPKAFPGFVVFPQMETTWGNAEASNSAVSYALRVIRLLQKQHNIDPDRIYIAGLSVGGQAVLKALTMADHLFAAAIVMSPIPFTKSFDFPGAVNIPIWLFQGGKDRYPRPVDSEVFVRTFKDAGGVIRYTLYEDAGHNTWSRAFREPEFFSWFLARKKTDLFIYHNDPRICASSDEGLRLRLPAGFAAYQWQRDEVTIENASTNEYIATTPGVYRARYSFVSSPTETDWNDWSNNATLVMYSPPAPPLFQQGTTFLPDLNNNNTATLYTEDTYENYYWEQNAKAATLPDSNIVQPTSGNAMYTVRVSDFSKCKSAPSEGKPVFFNNKAPVENGMRPTSFTGETITGSSVFLTWNDPSGLEKGFEIWRKNSSVSGSPWALATITKKNLNFYYDTMLVPGSTYHYKIRAISNTARTDYFPGNGASENVVINTPDSRNIPYPPQQLTGQLVGVNKIRLTWQPGKDESGIKEYRIVYGENTINTGSLETTRELSGLNLNQNYVFTVYTIDISGNVSPPSNQLKISTSVTGLFYKHSTGAWNSLEDPTIASTWDHPEHEGYVTNVTLQPRVQDDYFNFEFDGFIYINTPGEYTFYINSDDGSRLYLDESLVIDFDGFHGLCTGSASSESCPNGWGLPSAPINLSRGGHRIRILMFDYTGSHNLFVRYNGPDTGNETILIPDAALSSGSAPSGGNPSQATGLSATADGMTAIMLSWSASSTTGAEYEIYRSTSSSGPFEIIDRTAQVTYRDPDLIPGTTYYYRLRTVSSTGNSAQSAIVSAATAKDNVPPTVPGELRAESGNYVKVILRWNSSTDNVRVKGYEIFADNALVGFSPVPAFEVLNLEGGRIYNFHVVAVDVSGNKSAASASVNNELFITANVPEIKGEFGTRVFPNPCSSSEFKVSVKSNTPLPISLRIVDALGNRIFETVLTDFPVDEEFETAIGRFVPDGLYIITAEQRGRSSKEKVIIQN